MAQTGDTATATVQLEVYYDWSVWSAYPRESIPRYFQLTAVPEDEHGRRCIFAPTDGPEFYTDIAFPSLKPDIDILFVPVRTRKQRGWYQVNQPPSARKVHTASTIHISDSFSSLESATGRDMPPELFEQILQNFAPFFDEALTREEKHALGMCTLVSRYWARMCQRYLFQHLSLRSHQDWFALHSFLTSPLSRTTRYVRHLEIHASVHGPPWIHLPSLYVEDRVRRRGSGTCTVNLTLNGPIDLSKVRLRSIHSSLPRSTHAFSRPIRSLKISNVEFRTLNDLLKLVEEIPMLWQLECAGVKWGALPGHQGLKMPRKATPPEGWHSRSDEYYIAMFPGCDKAWVQASLWLLARSIGLNGQRIAEHDFTSFLRIGQIIEDAEVCLHESTRGASWGASSSYSVLKIFCHFPGPLEKAGDTICVACLKPEASSAELPTVIGQRSPIIPLCIDSITINLSSAEDAPSSRWGRTVGQLVESILSSFPLIRVVALAFRTKEQMAYFAKHVEKMTKLLTSGVLSYAVWCPAGEFTSGSWTRISADYQVEVDAMTQDLAEVYR